MSDARIAVQSGVDGTNMCIVTSPQLMKHSHGKDMAEKLLPRRRRLSNTSQSNGIEIRFSGEDSFRSDFSEILKLYSLVDRLGADRVGIADTVGGATPMEVYDKIDAPRKVLALEAGATHLNTTVLGIGERNGITPLGGLMACVIQTDRKFGLSKYELEKLGYLENLVAQIVGVEIPLQQLCAPPEGYAVNMAGGAEMLGEIEKLVICFIEMAHQHSYYLQYDPFVDSHY
ncbi:hypothetical protein B0T24DRAFT_683751 [Lasiosphaeria ovina]|uniref:Pyruvate carboxyltransferase domain-containing protein n=1 Tax=Lasiosphaeria ovina TaxID=92902 RepID=A0AAE0JW16_9PEZI|nr:hypothetical protein B0T24DRAFT_683751 [Lasiosphaeria ovina]